MRIYLDLCCFNRPYDDQGQVRIQLETQAKLVLQQKVREGSYELLWSSILDFENAHNPFEERLLAIQQWRALAIAFVQADAGVVESARTFMAAVVMEYDALHVASALAGAAQVFVTTDDRLLRSLRRLSNLPLRAVPPVQALAYVENWYEN